MRWRRGRWRNRVARRMGIRVDSHSEWKRRDEGNLIRKIAR